LAASARKLRPVRSRITAWWTMRSMVAAVVMGSLNMRSHWENTRFEVMTTRRRLAAFGQQGEQHRHFVPALLDVADVVEDEDIEGVRPVQFLL
jgi:hypothetical protein